MPRLSRPLEDDERPVSEQPGRARIPRRVCRTRLVAERAPGQRPHDVVPPPSKQDGGRPRFRERPPPQLAYRVGRKRDEPPVGRLRISDRDRERSARTGGPRTRGRPVSRLNTRWARERRMPRTNGFPSRSSRSGSRTATSDRVSQVLSAARLEGERIHSAGTILRDRDRGRPCSSFTACGDCGDESTRGDTWLSPRKPSRS